MTHQLDGHSKEHGEISFIGYGEEDGTIITTAWDRKIKVYKDEKIAEGRRQGGMTAAMRGAAKCHEKDITCADYHHKLGLIATGA